MASDVLSQLLKEAEAASNDDERDLDEQIEEQLDKIFGVSETYRQFQDEIRDLVEPLSRFLPNADEYMSYASPHDGLVAGPAWKMCVKMAPARKPLFIENPGLILTTEIERSKAINDGMIFPELDDDEYETYLHNAELMSKWWEKNKIFNEFDLAKSIVFHAVLEDDELREQVLRVASSNIEEMIEANLRLGVWVSSLPRE